MQDQTHLGRASGRRATQQGRPANSEAEPLRSKKQKHSSKVEAIPASSSLGLRIVIPGGRYKRDWASLAASQTDCTDNTSASIIEPPADTSGERPQKRRKRASSTPPAPRPSQLATQLRPHRRCRSRAGSPATDVEQVRPSRFSARLAKRNHPLLNGRNSDIYAHLAGPDGAASLLNDPPAGSVVLATSNEMAGSQADKKLKGRRRRTMIDLSDENAKRNLMEEWAQMRQSQGAFPLSGIDNNACFGQLLLRDTGKGDGSPSSTQPGAMTRRSSVGPELVPTNGQTTIIPPSQGTVPHVSPRGSSTLLDLENASLTRTDASGKTKALDLSLDGGAKQFIVPIVEVEAPSSSVLELRMDEDTPNDAPAQIPEIIDDPDLLQRPVSFPPSRKGSTHVTYAKQTRMRVNREAGAVGLGNPSGDSSPVIAHMNPVYGTMCLDSHEEFCMLDVPDVVTLPWEPVAYQLYVPPGLGKLISGMREQLRVEARARRRAEELYQVELNRRISAEKDLEGLRIKLEETRANATERVSN